MTNRAKRGPAVLAKACAMALGWSLVTASATDAALYWDTNGATAGSGAPTPSGTWDTVTSNWSTDANGLSPTQPWTPGETALFSAGSDATGQFTVTVNGTQTASEIDFFSGQAVLTGGGINFVGGGGRISVSTGANAAFQFALGGNAGLFLSGGGLLTLASANTYTGATSVQFASLALQDSAALGSTTGVAVGGSSALLLSGAGLNVPRPITLINGNGPTGIGALRNISNNNTYSGNITIGTGARIQSDAGTLTLAGTIDGHGPLTIGGAGSINVTGSIQTGTDGVTKVDSGLLTLTGSSTNTGPYTISNGTIKLAASERIANTAPLVVGSGTTAATFDMALLSETVGSLSGSGKIFDIGNLTVGGDNTSTTFGGVMSGSGNLTKIGSGTLTLSGSNGETGTVTISAGAIRVSGVGAHLGGNQAVVASGAALELGNNAVVNVPITINGSGIGNTGAIHRVVSSDTDTYGGPITLGSAARIGNDGSTLIVSGNTDNKGFDLTLGGAGLISFSGSITGKGGLIKEGTDVVLLLNSGNTYGGDTSINAGKLVINGSVASSINVNSGGTLGGAGTIANGSVTVNAGGHVAPGPATGGIATLNLHGDLSLLPQAVLEFDLDLPPSSDRIVMTTGTLHLNGQQFSDFVFSSKLANFPDGIFTLIDAASIDGSLGANVSGMIGTTPVTLAIQGNDLVLIAPEPGTGVLLMLAAAGFSVTGPLRRRR